MMRITSDIRGSISLVGADGLDVEVDDVQHQGQQHQSGQVAGHRLHLRLLRHGTRKQRLLTECGAGALKPSASGTFEAFLLLAYTY